MLAKMFCRWFWI